MAAAHLRGRRRQAGFTLAEIMVALVVFIIAIVGLVAMESRGIEAQRGAMELREGERIAQQTMAELEAKAFNEIIEFDFAGGLNPTFPYSDVDLGTSRIVDYRQAPADNDVKTPGARNDFYWVGRRMSLMPNAPANPIGPTEVDAVQMQVTVLWIDYTNPAFPPPATAIVANLTPNMLDATSPQFAPWVAGITLTTTRVNDAAPPLPPEPP